MSSLYAVMCQGQLEAASAMRRLGRFYDPFSFGSVDRADSKRDRYLQADATSLKVASATESTMYRRGCSGRLTTCSVNTGLP